MGEQTRLRWGMCRRKPYEVMASENHVETHRINVSARKVQRLALEDSGVSSIEYAMLASLIAVVIVAALIAMGISTSLLWGEVETAVAGQRYELKPF